jgi:hypothetical protein
MPLQPNFLPFRPAAELHPAVHQADGHHALPG